MNVIERILLNSKHVLYVNVKYNSHNVFLFQNLILATEDFFKMKSPL